MLFRIGEILGIKLKVGDELILGLGFNDKWKCGTIVKIIQVQETLRWQNFTFQGSSSEKENSIGYDNTLAVTLSGGKWYNLVWWE